MDADPDAGAADGYGGPLSPELRHGLETQWSGLLGPGYDVVVSTADRRACGLFVDRENYLGNDYLKFLCHTQIVITSGCGSARLSLWE